MILSAQSIRGIPELVTPFVERTVHKGGMSYGLANCGYDLTIGSLGKSFVDAVRMGVSYMSEEQWPEAQHRMMLPRGFLLISVAERIKLPNDIVGFIKDKSSWARKGLAVQNTVAEPGWEGHLTLELSNNTDDQLFLEIGMPICQLMFQWLDKATDSPYAGKYQNQPPKPVVALREGERC